MRLDEKYIPLAKSIANKVGREYRYHDQEDLESVAMLALVEAVAGINPDYDPAEVVSFLRVSIDGKVRNYISRDAYEDDLEDCDGVWFTDPVDDSHEDKLIAEETAQEREDMLHDAIKQLTPQQQRVVKLLHFEGKTQGEAAVMLGISQQAIDKLNQKVMRNLKKELWVKHHQPD